jgi:hypothetical protein
MKCLLAALAVPAVRSGVLKELRRSRDLEILLS